MLTLLTTTGERPNAWALCQRWMAQQIYSKPVRWVIVDDGTVAQEITFERDNWTLQVIRPLPHWQEGQNTQARNLLVAMDAIRPDDMVVFVEDDDYYAPTWLQTVESNFHHAELIGERRAFYYNVATRRFNQLQNQSHASLCSSAIRGKALNTFRQVCKPGVKFIDVALWRMHPNQHLFDGELVTGIKGFSGRRGIGMGHDVDFGYRTDFDGSVLRNRIGENADVYLNHAL